MQRFRIIVQSLMLTSLAIAVTPSDALIDLPAVPVWMSSTDPNMMFLIDDSWPMMWEIVTVPHYDACNYQTGTVGTCNTLRSDGSEWVKVGSVTQPVYYLFGNTDNPNPGVTCTANSLYNGAMQCPAVYGNPTTVDWRVYSADYNALAYNPNQNYSAWAGPCNASGGTCSAADAATLRSDPYQANAGYSSTQTLSQSPLSYAIMFGDSNASGGNDGNAYDWWNNHYEINFTSSSSAQFYYVTYSGTTPNRQGPFSLSAGVCYNILGSKTLAAAVKNAGTITASGSAGCRTVTQAAQNYVNWYQYYRRGFLLAKGVINNTVSINPQIRFGASSMTGSFFQPLPGFANSYQNADTTLLKLLNARIITSSSSTLPMRSSLASLGSYFQGSLGGQTNPATDLTELNYAVLLTNSYWSNTDSVSVGNMDGDAYPNTLADVATFYWGRIGTGSRNNTLYSNSATHMRTIGLVLGRPGYLNANPNTGWPSAYTAGSNWGNPFSTNAASVDDIWHAAFDSDGLYVNSTDPQFLTGSLISVIASARSKVPSALSASMPADAGFTSNQDILDTQTVVYGPYYEAANWAGHLIANSFGAGTPSVNWDAACELAGGTCGTGPAGNGISANNRVIITRSTSTGAGIAFRWPVNYLSPAATELSNTQVASFLGKIAADANLQTTGQNLVNYLRGDHSQEQPNGPYRARITTAGDPAVLGDIMHSRPVYVGAPALYYPDSLENVAYSSFEQAYANRSAMIYAGANDGMLHGFIAASGIEALGFVPTANPTYQNLSDIANPLIIHHPFVDASPNSGDIFMNGAWHTVLSGGLGSGGRGIYLLDITDPANFTEANAARIVQWEFTSSDDADLGFTYGQPQLGKMANGQWAVITGNGYDSAAGIAGATGTGQAALFILFANHAGTSSWTRNLDYVKIAVGSPDSTAGNGLATPVLVDVNSDYVVDYIYAGDLQGNVWKFDVESADPTAWSASLFYSAGSTQPISSAPTVGKHPLGISSGALIYVGSGKYLEYSDNSNNVTQSFYALWDKFNGYLPSAGRLLSHSITKSESEPLDVTADGKADTTVAMRINSSTAINWTNNDGWVLNLDDTSTPGNEGDRVVNKPILQNGVIEFVSTVPPLLAGNAFGGSWIMILNAADGNPLQVSPLDINLDNKFTTADYVDGTTITGFSTASLNGINAELLPLLDATRASQILFLNGSNGSAMIKESIDPRVIGQQNYRKLQ